MLFATLGHFVTPFGYLVGRGVSPKGQKAENEWRFGSSSGFVISAGWF
ncbi:MAG: hypothetical protein STSR0007_07680 [Thermovirga sp.]